ncbi:hypothetical protein LOC71_12175 [Rhodopirellula sp. JC740]|uniref:Uncharacterized protein n=1 Tax=Rhodopirellula halodulae TaxID=2894198 RepID=A0ABS8NHI9_9BACT|nr:hypothetical protein [Rhodopirellula sp. JC740]MCC9643034.1 hypothetical protein [Rhodopirellula sp. JC740]
MSEKQKEQQKRARRAASDLNRWSGQFRLGSCRIETPEQRLKETAYLTNVISFMFSGNQARIGSKLEEIAAFVRSEGSECRYAPDVVGSFADRLFFAAECEKDPMNNCPWRQCLEKIRSQPRMFAFGKSLWARNPERRHEWAIDLDALKRDVWGDEETSTSTVGTLVYEFRKQLKAAKVPLTISVHDTYENRRVSCTLPDDFEFTLSG